MLPDSFYEDIKKYVETQVQSIIGKMNLVSRDEVEELEKTLLQLREKIEALEELAAKPQQPEPDVVETFENEGGFIPPDPETNNKYEREVEERPRWKNAFGEVITPAEKATFKRDQDKKEVKEQLE